jgi:hypothetical protein
MEGYFMEKPIQKIRMHYRELQQERHSWETHWLDVRDLIEPQRGRRITGHADDTNRGDRKSYKRVNGVATRALNILASGMQSGLTSKARQWFMLSHPDQDLNKYRPVRMWYDQVQTILEGVFRRSNIYSSFLHVYKEMAAFGQGAVLLTDHPDNTLFTKPYTTGTYYMSVDEWGAVDAFFQTEWLSARQIVGKYGMDAVTSDIRHAYETGKLEARYEVVNAYLLHPEQYGLSVNENRPVASVHFLAQSGNEDRFLKVSGFYSFPVMTPRWDVIDNDVYGQSPTRDVIEDVKMLQSMAFDMLKGVKKTVSPPMRIPPELERRGLNTSPDALNVVSSMNEHAVAPLITPGMNLQHLQASIAELEGNIRDGYYNSLFLALLTQDNPQMTAREVAERHEEKLLMLGPVLERIHSELLDPVLARTYMIAYNAGLIPPPPMELEGEPVQIEYISILSQAQKAVGVNRIEQSLSFMANMAAVYPEIRHAVDPYRTLESYNNMIGVQADIFVDEDDYNQKVAQEQQQQQLAQGAATAESMANSAKVIGEADMANVRDLLTGGNLAL